MKVEKKYYGKDPKISIWNWKLSLSLGSSDSSFSLHSAVHSFDRMYFVNSAGFKMLLIFFPLSVCVCVCECFIRSISTFSIRFHSLLYLVVQPFHPVCFDDRATARKKNSYSYILVFLPQFVSVFNFEFAKCIRFQSILSSISR